MSDTKNDNATVESSNKDAVTEEKFNEQAYLLYQHESLIKSNLNKNYKNFVQLIGHPSILLSKLLGTGVDAFFSITPAQLSLLHPSLLFPYTSVLLSCHVLSKLLLQIFQLV